MKVLLIKPMEHPQVVDIENSLKEFYRILDCDCMYHSHLPVGRTRRPGHR